jgi:hypothetical protein
VTFLAKVKLRGWQMQGRSDSPTDRYVGVPRDGRMVRRARTTFLVIDPLAARYTELCGEAKN